MSRGKKTPEEHRFNQAVAQVVRQRREHLGITQAGLSERTGISIGAIRQWEQGQNVPTLWYLLKLARGLEIAPYTLAWRFFKIHKEEGG